MDKLKLEAKTREVFGKKNRELREKGLIPATVYGKKVGPFSISVDAKQLNDIYRKAGDNTVVELAIEGSGNHHVLIQDIAQTPVSGEIIHVDFHAISLTEKVKAFVEIEIVGDNDLLKAGGNAILAMNEIEVEALPTQLPHKIEVDISGIKEFGETIYVKDLKISADVKVLSDENNPVITLSEPEKIEVEEVKPETAIEGEGAKVEEVAEEGKEKTE